MIRPTILVSGLAALLLLSGCNQEPDYIGKETVMESSAKKQPKWVKKPPKKTLRYYYFVGKEDSKQNDDRYAYQRAVAQISEFLNTRAETLYKTSAQTTNTNEMRQLRDEYIKTVSQASIGGVMRKARYWERIGKLRETGVDYFYRVYVLVQIHKKDLKESEARTLAAQKRRVGTDSPLYKQLLAIEAEVDKD